MWGDLDSVVTRRREKLLRTRKCNSGLTNEGAARESPFLFMASKPAKQSHYKRILSKFWRNPSSYERLSPRRMFLSDPTTSCWRERFGSSTGKRHPLTRGLFSHSAILCRGDRIMSKSVPSEEPSISRWMILVGEFQLPTSSPFINQQLAICDSSSG